MSIRRYSLTWILSVAVLLRVVTAIYLGNEIEALPGTSDQVSYHALATRLIEGHGFTFGERWWPRTDAGAPTAHWSYLYTFYLAGIYTLFGPHPLIARLIQAMLVGLLQTYFTFRIAEHIFGRTAGLAAALLSAIYSYFIYYAANLMTESFYITAILASLYMSVRISARATTEPNKSSQRLERAMPYLLGFALGLTVLLRQLFLLFIPLLFLWMWWASRGKQIKAILIATAILVSLIIPFTVYNYLRFDRFVLLNTNAGFAFFWGNHPIYGTRFHAILPADMGSYQSLIPPELRHLNEAALDQALLKRGIQFIIEDPGRYVLLSLSRIPAYFAFWPSGNSSSISNISRVAGFGVFLPIILYGLLKSVHQWYKSTTSRSSSALLLLLLFTSVYTAIHILSWALIRYRLPVDAVFIVFAGFGLINLAERFQGLRSLITELAQT